MTGLRQEHMARYPKQKTPKKCVLLEVVVVRELVIIYNVSERGGDCRNNFRYFITFLDPDGVGLFRWISR
jgi:hypothetical protein